MGTKTCEVIDTAERCPHCGKPIKIGIIRLMGVEKRIKIMCPCQLAESRRRDADIERRGTVEKIYMSSGLTPSQRKITFDGWMKRPGAERAYTACANYAKNFGVSLRHRGIGMYFYGTTGSGKTRLACAVANALIQQQVPVVMWNVPSLLEALKAAYDGQGTAAEILRDAHHATLLILDDLGSEKPTEWTRNTLYELLNSRIENVLPTIVTSNFAPGDRRLAAMLGPRIVSRLNQRDIFPPISNTATDYRRERHEYH